MGGLALSPHCFNPSNTGGSFSPSLPPQSLFPPLSSSLVMKYIYWRRKQLLLLLLLLGLAPLSLLHDLSPAREGRAWSNGAGPWGPRTSRGPFAFLCWSCPPFPLSLLPTPPPPPPRPRALPVQPWPCSVERHISLTVLWGQEPSLFVAPLPGE